MVGSWVWNPGDKQASPTSCMLAPAEGLELSGAGTFVVVFKSSRRGRWRPLAASDGEEGGSFFTIIFGFAWLREDNGDFFPFPAGGVVLSLDSVGPFEECVRSDGVAVNAGARGAYDRGLGCRSSGGMGAGLGAATAVDILSLILGGARRSSSATTAIWRRLSTVVSVQSWELCNKSSVVRTSRKRFWAIRG